MNIKENFNITKGHTLKEYQNKYLRFKNSLLYYSKKEVLAFDKKYGYFVDASRKKQSLRFKNRLLHDRTWWEIDDKYYEIPEAPSLIWFKSTKTSTKCAIFLAASVIISGCVLAPIYLVKHFNDNKNLPAKEILNPLILIDSQKSFPSSVDDYTKNLITKGTTINTKLENDSISYKISLNSAAKATLYHINEIFNVKRGNNIFISGKDYTLETEKSENGYVYSHTVKFSLEHLKQFSGTVSITPVYAEFEIIPIPPVTIDKLDFVLSQDNSYYKVKAKSSNISGEISIPSTYNDKPVKIIDNNAFKNCMNITEAYLPKTITEVGDNAFENSSLSYINFKDNVDSKIVFGKNAFSNITNLWYISFPSHLSEIKDACFSNCNSLSIVNLSRISAETIPEIPSLKDDAFQGCATLETIYVWDESMKNLFSNAEGWKNLSKYFVNII